MEDWTYLEGKVVEAGVGFDELFACFFDDVHILDKVHEASSIVLK
jgi:hypothetical protein